MTEKKPPGTKPQPLNEQSSANLPPIKATVPMPNVTPPKASGGDKKD